MTSVLLLTLILKLAYCAHEGIEGTDTGLASGPSDPEQWSIIEEIKPSDLDYRDTDKWTPAVEEPVEPVLTTWEVLTHEIEKAINDPEHAMDIMADEIEIVEGVVTIGGAVEEYLHSDPVIDIAPDPEVSVSEIAGTDSTTAATAIAAVIATTIPDVSVTTIEDRPLPLCKPPPQKRANVRDEDLKNIHDPWEHHQRFLIQFFSLTELHNMQPLDNYHF